MYICVKSYCRLLLHSSATNLSTYLQIAFLLCTLSLRLRKPSRLQPSQSFVPVCVPRFSPTSKIFCQTPQWPLWQRLFQLCAASAHAPPSRATKLHSLPTPTLQAPSSSPQTFAFGLFGKHLMPQHVQRAQPPLQRPNTLAATQLAHSPQTTL
jgi:hypothetical protein